LGRRKRKRKRSTVKHAFSSIGKKNKNQRKTMKKQRKDTMKRLKGIISKGKGIRKTKARY
jgi:hypothetical protein